MEYSKGNTRLLRSGRYSDAGVRAMATFTTANRAPHFLHHALATIAADSFPHFQRTGRCYNYAWVVMPDHVHWVLQLQGGDMSALVRMYKTWVARAAKCHGVTMPFWSRGFHDRRLPTSAAVNGAVSYVRANPSRAGLNNWKFVYPALDD